MAAKKKSNPEILEAKLLSVLPTPAGFAVFLNSGEKTGVIYVDPSIGLALPSLSRVFPNPRPLTHEVIHDMMTSFGINLTNVCINDVQDGVFYARIIMKMENEVCDLKIVELDIRSSDAMALCLKFNKPLHITQKVWDVLEDVTPYYESLLQDRENNNLMDLA